MQNQFSRSLLFLIVLILTSPNMGRAEFRGHPDLASKAPTIKTIFVVSPLIDMYELGAGGQSEAIPEWSQAASANVRQALLNEFAKREQLHVTAWDEQVLAAALRSNYEQSLLLFNIVSEAILAHAISWQNVRPGVRTAFFPEKARSFTYSLGKDVTELAPNVDAFLFVRGFDQRSTSGRKALGVLAAIIGGGGNAARLRGGNLFTATLVDAKNGDVLWFTYTLKPFDPRDLGDAQKLAVEFMIDLPTLGQIP